MQADLHLNPPGFTLVVQNGKFHDAQSWPEMCTLLKLMCKLTDIEIDAVRSFIKTHGFCHMEK